MGMTSNIRTFVAIELPENVRADLWKLQHEFTSCRLDIRWVKPLNIHLTLNFLGDVDPSDVEAIARLLSETVEHHPVFELVPRGVGVFPDIQRPRVLWTGIEGQTDILGSLQKSLAGALKLLGCVTEKRPFRGHLTLGRIKRRIHQKRLVAALREHQTFVSQVFSIERLVLFKSELHPGGARYTKLHEMRLGKERVS